MPDRLSPSDQATLHLFARRALERAVARQDPEDLDLLSLSPEIVSPGASFVTLTLGGQLRGCVGTLEPTQPLVLDVCKNTVSAALSDPRFPALRADEIEDLQIEISYLTPPIRFAYEHPHELVSGLRPGVDGVVLKQGTVRATFLPKVWAKIPQPEVFLDQLCLKMGVSADTWREVQLEVFIYQVDTFAARGEV